MLKWWGVLVQQELINYEKTIGLCLKEIIVAIMKRNLVAQIKFNSVCFSIDNI